MFIKFTELQIKDYFGKNNIIYGYTYIHILFNVFIIYIKLTNGQLKFCILAIHECCINLL